MLDILSSLIDIYKRNGEQTLPNGTRLICPTPFVAPKAWLHQIFYPLNNADISELEAQLTSYIPSQYKAFLQEANGVNLFNTSLCFYGFRLHLNTRNSWETTAQPFSILTPNTIESRINCLSDVLVIGGYDWDGSELYMNPENEVFRVGLNSQAPINYLPSFEEMLKQEIERLTTLYDFDGRAIDEDQATVPNTT